MLKRICVLAIMLIGLPALSHAEKASELPQPIVSQEMESQAEELVVALLAKDQTKSKHYYSLISSSLNKLHQAEAGSDFDERRAREVIMTSSWLRLISIDLDHAKWVGAAIAANQMRGEIIRFTNFPKIALRDVAWMNYLGSDLMLLCMENPKENLELIGLRKDALSETWNHVEKEVIANFSNKPLVVRGDQLIRQINDETDANRLIQLCKDELNLVTDIRKVLAHS